MSHKCPLFDRDHSYSLLLNALGFGGADGIAVFGLLETPQVFDASGLLILPAEALVLLPDMTVDELMQIYLSLGVVVPDSITLNKSP